MPSHGRNPSEHHGDPMIAGLPYSVVTGVRTISCMRKHSRRAISAVRSGELVYGQRNCARLQFPSNVDHITASARTHRREAMPSENNHGMMAARPTSNTNISRSEKSESTSLGYEGERRTQVGKMGQDVSPTNARACLQMVHVIAVDKLFEKIKAQLRHPHVEQRVGSDTCMRYVHKRRVFEWLCVGMQVVCTVRARRAIVRPHAGTCAMAHIPSFAIRCSEHRAPS
jgi:hypothetical protein